MTYQPTDDDVRSVYATLIEKSWEAPENFESHQEAWKVIEEAWRIKEVKDGRVVRND